MDEMRECGNQTDNMEHALEHGTKSTPVHHPLYLCPFIDIYKSHEMGDRVIALNADSVFSPVIWSTFSPPTEQRSLSDGLHGAMIRSYENWHIT